MKFLIVCLCSIFSFSLGQHYLTKQQYAQSVNYTVCSPATDGDSLYNYSAVLLNNQTLHFNTLRGKVVLLVNVATFCQSRIEYPALNRLVEEFGDELVVVAFPSNQFANQEPGENEEILNSIKYARPGNGFVPKFHLTKKVLINGPNGAPVFDFLKRSCISPKYDYLSVDWYFLYKPVHARDVRWNFEKFLIDANGHPVHRYRTDYHADRIAPHIRELLKDRVHLTTTLRP